MPEKEKKTKSWLGQVSDSHHAPNGERAERSGAEKRKKPETEQNKPERCLIALSLELLSIRQERFH